MMFAMGSVEQKNRRKPEKSIHYSALILGIRVKSGYKLIKAILNSRAYVSVASMKVDREDIGALTC